MGQFINDTLSKQIERGEVFYGEVVSVEVADFTPQYFKIVTDANEVSLRMGVVAKDDIALVLTKGGALTGTSVPLANMNTNSATTMGTTVTYGTTGPSTGINVMSTVFANGETSPLTPTGIESGIILEPSTTYVGYVIPICGSPLWPYVSFFLRDV